MQRNMVLFVVLSLLVFLGWAWLMQVFYPAPAPPAAAGRRDMAQPSPAARTEFMVQSKAPMLAKSRSAREISEEKRVTVRTGEVEAILSSTGARIISWKLLAYPERKGDPEPVELIPPGESGLHGALEIEGAGLAEKAWTLEEGSPRRDAQGRQEVSFSTALEGTPIRLRKRFIFDGSQVELVAEVRNTGQQDLRLSKTSLLWGPNIGRPDLSQQSKALLSGVVQMEGRVERERPAAGKVFTYAQPRWVALKSHYFVAAFLPDGGSWPQAEIRGTGDSKISVALVSPEWVLKAGEARNLEARLYAGPQIYETLRSFGRNLQAVVQFQFWSALDWLNPLCVGMLHVLRWFHKVTGNWGLAIILLTALVRGLLFYPSQRSMVSMRRMQTKMKAMQPRLDTLKKTYKDDPQKLNAEMMKLYKEYGVNPLGGCLPMLVQIPIFFALYGTLMAAFELRGARFFWKWDDLSGPDPTHLFALFMGATMYLQQKMTPSASATLSEEQQQMQKMMLYLMPVMFTVMAIWFKWPTGLLLYWSVSNVFAIAQQWYVNKMIS